MALSAADAATLKLEIKRRLAPFDAMDALAWIASLGVRAPVELPPGADELLLERVEVGEYLACLLLERPTSAPTSTAPAPAEQLEFVAAMAGAFTEASALSKSQGDGLLRGAFQSGLAIEAVAAGIELSDQWYRFGGTQEQIRHLLDELFPGGDEVSESLTALVGFDCQDALRLADAIASVLLSKISDYRQGIDETLGEEPAELGSEEWLFHLKDFVDHFLRPGDYVHWTFTADEIATASALQLDVAQAFLEIFSIGFGELRAGRPLLTGRNEVRRRPLVRDAHERFLALNHPNLVWSIRPTLEERLRADRGAWNRYLMHRAAWLEERASRLLEKALHVSALRNVSFRLASDPKPLWEVDVLMRVDDVCCVVEAKSGAVSEKARKGRTTDARHDLESLIAKSSRQAARLGDAITAGEDILFVDRSSGHPVRFPLAGITRVEPIVVTLEDLTPIVANVASLRAADLIAQEIDVPWIVNVFDLEAIVRTVQFTAQLTTYVAQRRHLAARVFFNDETDLWAAFLTSSLSIRNNREPLVAVIGPGRQLHPRFPHEPTPDMSMRLTASQARRLRRLHRDRHPGWLAEAEAIIAKAQHGRALSSTRQRRLHV